MIIFLESKNIGHNNLKLTGTIPKYLYPLFYDFVNYCRNKIGIDNTTINLNFKQVKNNEIGFVNFSNVLNGENKIIIDKNASYPFLLKYIAHELTHIKQIINKELQIKEGFFIWNNERNISIAEYNIIIKNYDFDTYKNLEWEKEAYDNQYKILNDYISTDSLKNLATQATDPTLKYILLNAF